jgi:hypothetical protein
MKIRSAGVQGLARSQIVKLDRTQPFGKICGDIYQPPGFDRPVKYEQDGRCFDVHGCEIVPRVLLVPSDDASSSTRRRPGALTKEYESLLKLLGGMARGAYKWDSARVQCVTEILDDALVVGLNIDEHAVIKLVRQASELITGSELHFVAPTITWCLEDRDILLGLVGILAKFGYGWCPSKTRSEVTTDIHNDVLKLGLSIDIDTVRKYLKLASVYLPALRSPNA